MQHGHNAVDRGSRSAEIEKMRERDGHTYGYANLHYIHSSILLSHFWAVHRVRLVFRHSLHTHDASTRAVLVAELMPSPEGGRCNGHFFLRVCTKMITINKTTHRKLAKKLSRTIFRVRATKRNYGVTMTFALQHLKFCYLIKASRRERERKKSSQFCAYGRNSSVASMDAASTTSHGLSHFCGTVTCSSTVMANYGVWVVRTRTE